MQILSSEQINREKWDACVASAGNGLIYSYSFYLDGICSHWSGYVVGDYKAVMPLPFRSKYGIRYIYQPAFIQQLGLVGDGNVEVKDLLSFARYGEILLNFRNEQIAKNWNAGMRSNLVIDLSKGYDFIQSNYKKDLALNLKKAAKQSFTLSNHLNIDLAVDRYKTLYQPRMKSVKDNDLESFRKLAGLLAEKEMCFTREVSDKNGNVVSTGLFLKDEKRIYNIMNATTDEGRSKEANHFLLDAVIKEFSGRRLLFDFEGSDIPGVKSFYEKFGAIDQPYFYFRYNHLPAILKLFKS